MLEVLIFVLMSFSLGFRVNASCKSHRLHLKDSLKSDSNLKVP